MGIAYGWDGSIGAESESPDHSFGTVSVLWAFTGDGNEQFIEYELPIAVDLWSGAHSQLYWDMKTDTQITLTRIRLYDDNGEWIQEDLNEVIQPGDFEEHHEDMRGPDLDSLPGPFFPSIFKICRWYFQTVNLVNYNIRFDHVRFEKRWLY